jgi:hypothetical protein
LHTGLGDIGGGAEVPGIDHAVIGGVRLREAGELADCFSFYLGEEGFDRSEGLSDAQHKKLIRKQYKEFLSAMEDGLL